MNIEHLKCPICMEIFDGNVFILKCGHNLCSTCLPKLYQQQGLGGVLKVNIFLKPDLSEVSSLQYHYKVQ